MGEEVARRGSGSSSAGDGHVKLKKELGLLEGVAVILGIIIGSGIFISPKGVLVECGSVGMSLVVWSLCGLLSMIGALCYAELGTTIPKSGGDYAYILEAFGPLPAFLFLWDANLIFVPTTNAIMGLTFGNYVLQPFFPNCDINSYAVRLLAAAAICILTFINCYNVKVTTRLQNLFMVTKLLALVLVIVVGLVVLCMGNGQSFSNAFDGMSTDPGQIAVSFYSGIFSYAGWNYLNFMTEELKDPYRNLPRSIYLSLPLVTCIYVLANVAYLVVLSPYEMLASDAIAVTFANKTLGVMAWVMPLFVAFSAFGGLSVHIMTSSRLCFVGARNGHFPGALALISQKYITPTPSLVFLGLLSLVYLCTSDIFALINYASFIESSFILCSISGLLYLRWKEPARERPIRVNIVIPILFLMICGFLVFMPLYVKPIEVGMGILITFTGVPAYLVFVYWKNKPQWALRVIDNFNRFTQKLFLALKED
ncbi:Y+L amino acid transporter 2-like isoform X1 [Pollicipes pollicipes]|uniref:Y+L amino acid transporter 2-like isoform X1 n=1 Tax=Pollicipes pollicipes TaxID=41117 RepID=UPI0018851B9E|nr:Y+L amino acid transporter 2-like isoform X1 [Pollicipes pollicipes]XP_037091886.1 Y+L amino acid transporter 2-like isoform X1 [Pollicipes pollicipes]